MQDLTGKEDATSGANGSLGADQWNQFPTEVQNIITALGQALSALDLNQLGKSIAGYVAHGDFYSDIGSVNSYTLSTIDGKQSPPSYSDGMTARFICNSTNTGASIINVAGLGSTDLKASGGGDLLAGSLSEISVNNATYNEASGEFWLCSDSSNKSVLDIASLRLQAPTIEGQIYTLRGHTVSGLGGGQFYYDQSDTVTVDDNGLCIVTTGGHRIKRLHTAGNVCVEWFGAGSTEAGIIDSTAGVQAADNAYDGGDVFFGEGVFAFSGINKNIGTTWQGVGAGSNPSVSVDIISTRCIPNADGSMITTDSTGMTAYGTGGIKQMRFYGILDGGGTPVYTADAISLLGGTRQQYIEDVYIRNFVDGIEVVGGGEIYGTRVFISQCSNSLRLKDMADSWFTECAFGSGLSFTGVGGYGVLSEDCNAVHFTACRFQVSKQNGARFSNCEDIQLISPIVDQNENFGINLIDCKRVNIDSPDIFDNGTVASPKAGVLIQSTGGGVTEDIKINGGNIYDRDVGGAGEQQSTAIQFSNSGTMAGVIIDGVGMRDITTPFLNADQVDGSCRILNIEGLKVINANSGDANFTINPDSAHTYVYSDPLTSNRQVLFSGAGKFDGEVITVIRRASSNDGNTLFVRSSAVAPLTNIDTIAAGESKRFVYSEDLGELMPLQ